MEKNLQEKVKLVETQLQEKEAALQKERALVEQLTGDVDTLEDKLDRALQRLRRCKGAYDQTLVNHEISLSEKEAELKQVRKEKDEKVELLKIRSSELTATQKFLSKADSVSEAEVLQIVNDLNEQIMQTATSLAEVSETPSPRQSWVVPDALVFVGVTHGQLLAHKLKGNNPELLQVALQIGIIRVVRQISVAWDWYNDLSVLDKVYARIYAAGEIGVCGDITFLIYLCKQRSNQSQEGGEL
jgi:hypothetical protein